MTYLEIINSVLRRLRENTVSISANSTYATMIGEFVNDAKEEVERAHLWNALRNTVTITTTPSTSQYSLTGLGQSFTILEVYNETNKYVMCQVSPAELKKRQLFTSQEGIVIEYAFNGVDSNGDIKVDFWPTPNTLETVSFHVYKPQAALSSDSTVLLIPSKPVVLGAYWRAVRERGEDGGNISPDAEKEYRTALGDAIAMDSEHTNHQTDWVSL